MGRRIETGAGIGREVDEESVIGVFLESASRSTIGFVVEGEADDEEDEDEKEEDAGEAGFLATTSRGFGLSLRWAFC